MGLKNIFRNQKNEKNLSSRICPKLDSDYPRGTCENVVYIPLSWNNSNNYNFLYETCVLMVIWLSFDIFWHFLANDLFSGPLQNLHNLSKVVCIFLINSHLPKILLYNPRFFCSQSSYNYFSLLTIPFKA